MSAPRSSPSHRTTAPRLSAQPVAARAAEASPTYCFSVQAAADPGMLPRVLELFAKRNLVPSRCHAVVTGPEHRSQAWRPKKRSMWRARCARWCSWRAC
jgi:hypothetical protein